MTTKATLAIAPQMQAVLDMLHPSLGSADSLHIHDTGIVPAADGYDNLGYADLLIRDGGGGLGGTVRLYCQDPEEGIDVHTFDVRGRNTSHAQFSTGSGWNFAAVCAYVEQMIRAARAS